ncbi:MULTISPECIES: DUF2231 domain-containing protein [unclassified Gordonia (in: high G+C Gram-positive bacteria)]
MGTINGLPAHPLFVHLAVVAIPLAAILGITAALWPAARRRLGVITPIVALVAMIITPLTTSAGESLAKTKEPNSVLARHIDLGDQMIYWVAPLFVAITLGWAITIPVLRQRVPSVSDRTYRIVSVTLSTVVVIAAVGSIVMVFLVGDSGARSVWTE